MLDSRLANSRLAANAREQKQDCLVQSRLKKTAIKSRIKQVKETTSPKKLLQQLIILIVAGILLIVLFLTAIFPVMVHYTGVENSKKYNPAVAQIKPQTPMFNAPATATNSAQLLLDGFTSNKAQVQFVIDGEKSADNLISVGENGEFTFSYTFDEGEHTLSAYAIDAAGLESEPTKEYQILIDQIVPDLVIDDLRDGEEIVGKEKKILTIRGVTEPRAQVIINSQRVRADDEGTFSLDYTLQNGDNKLKILAYDAAGNQVEKELTIKFTP